MTPWRRPGSDPDRVLSGRYFGPTTPSGEIVRLDPSSAAPDIWDRRLPTAAELEELALAEDARRRAALGELMLGIPDKAARSELLWWALRQFVDAPTAPTVEPTRTRPAEPQAPP